MIDIATTDKECDICKEQYPMNFRIYFKENVVMVFCQAHFVLLIKKGERMIDQFL